MAPTARSQTKVSEKRRSKAKSSVEQNGTTLCSIPAAEDRAANGDDINIHSVQNEVLQDACRVVVDDLVKDLCFLPEVFVFDLDDTLWRGDIDLTSGPPFLCKGVPEAGKNGTEKKPSGFQVWAKNGETLHPFPDVPDIFDWLEAGERRAAIASATGRGDWAEHLLRQLQTSRDTSFSSIASIKEMHRAETVANRSKAVHLRKIAQKAGCELCQMVFFDNMEHNIKDGESVGVTSCFTPDGLTWSKLRDSLLEFDRRALERAASGG
eukprot:TRINITY_DN35651_c0_g1_i1.p1 TRINITY_DN35651_c0_g1~~TRINITY_DN35651_c0_g1_i1.p1  ORF type:complete len:292 (-),score=68.34 TRINITY_DN35651_c0_g1_i1:41-838(-)